MFDEPVAIGPPSAAQPPSVLGAGRISLGSLAQQARKRHLRTARGIYIFVGLITIGANALIWAAAESLVDRELRTETTRAPVPGQQLDPVQLEETRSFAVRALRIFSAVSVLIGALFLVFAVIVNRYPVPVTISGLAVYFGSSLAFGLIDPSTLVTGLLVKIIIVVALVKAVQAAVAYERDSRSRADAAAA